MPNFRSLLNLGPEQPRAGTSSQLATPPVSQAAPGHQTSTRTTEGTGRTEESYSTDTAASGSNSPVVTSETGRIRQLLGSLGRPPTPREAQTVRAFSLSRSPSTEPVVQQEDISLNSPERVRRDLGLDETEERFDWTQNPFTAGLSFGTASSSTLSHIAQPTPLQGISIFEPTEVPRSIRQDTHRRLSLQLPHRSESTPNLNQNSESSTLADPTVTIPNQGSNSNQPPVVASTNTGPINTQSIPPPYTTAPDPYRSLKLTNHPQEDRQQDHHPDHQP